VESLEKGEGILSRAAAKMSRGRWPSTNLALAVSQNLVGGLFMAAPGPQRDAHALRRLLEPRVA